MIAYLKGVFSVKTPTHVILDCNGLGYHVNISLNTFSAIQEMAEGKLHTHLHIKEDAHTLFGFFTEQERDLFVKLISISGVGPATGRMILSSLTPKEVTEAIITENVSLIQSVKGIGPKSAKRLVLELKDKLEKSTDGISVAASGLNYQQEAVSALVMLGFNRNTAEKAILKVKSDNPGLDSVEDYIKRALKIL